MENKFSLPEKIILFLIAGSSDLFEFIFGLIGLFPPLLPLSVALTSLTGFLGGGVIAIILYFKKANASWATASMILETLPILNILPLKTITLALSFYLSDYPEAEKGLSLKNFFKKP